MAPAMWVILSFSLRCSWENITEDDKHEGEVVSGLGVAGAEVDVSSQGHAHQDGHTADTLHKTPAAGKVFGTNPGKKK